MATTTTHQDFCPYPSQTNVPAFGQSQQYPFASQFPGTNSNSTELAFLRAKVDFLEKQVEHPRKSESWTMKGMKVVASLTLSYVIGEYAIPFLLKNAETFCDVPNPSSVLKESAEKISTASPSIFHEVKENGMFTVIGNTAKETLKPENLVSKETAETVSSTFKNVKFYGQLGIGGYVLHGAAGILQAVGRYLPGGRRY